MQENDKQSAGKFPADCLFCRKSYAIFVQNYPNKFFKFP